MSIARIASKAMDRFMAVSGSVAQFFGGAEAVLAWMNCQAESALTMT